jgi:predicted outer membrane protein
MAVVLLAATVLAGPALAQTNTTKVLTGSGFLQKQAKAMLLDAQLGLLAVSKSQNTLVQKYGREVYVNDIASYQQAHNIAYAQAITLPQTLNTDQQHVMNSLSSLAGTQFDQAFIAFMVQHHQTQLAQCQFAAQNVVTSAVRNFADQEVTIQSNHLAMALNIDESL